MTRELRQANKVWTPGKTQIYVNIGDDKHVLYDCDAVHPDNPAQRQCLRWEAAVGAELPLDQPGQVVVERRVPGDVFTYAPNLISPTYVEVQLEVPQSGEPRGRLQREPRARGRLLPEEHRCWLGPGPKRASPPSSCSSRS